QRRISSKSFLLITHTSKGHSSHVLRCLDEQRLRDTLCDVTVAVEGQSFRAHRSVLASCSDYFAHRISSLAQPGAVITLPQEVTVAGFEPLLKFAYTSKLHFRKDDVVDIRNSASILGFRDLDEACFDFLLPKFFSSSAGSAVRKTCCKKKCKRRLSEDELGNVSDDVMSDEKEVKPVADSSSQQEVAWLCNKSANSKMESNSSAGNITPVTEGTNDSLMQCPKYRRQLACGKKICEKSQSSPVTLIRDDCDLSSSSYSSTASSKNESDVEHPGNSTSNTTERQSSGTFGKGPIDSGWLETRQQGQPASVEGAKEGRERSTLERDVADYPQLSFPDPDTGSSSDTGSGKAQSKSLEWLNFCANLSSKRSGCPFLPDQDRSKCLWKGAELYECEGTSQSGVSSLNSGEDGDSGTETEGDSEAYTRERARQVKLPFSVDWVVELSRNDFQQLLKQQVFTQEQLEFVHDMRRRSKNRLAAQRCRKRKLDCIYNLQNEINKLKAEREKLMVEKGHLGQLKLKTCHSVSALCQRVCSEANLQPEQLQVFAKYTSPGCPLSSAFPHIDALLSQHRLPAQVSGSSDCPQDSVKGFTLADRITYHINKHYTHKSRL
uniref:Uncharacterized protein n=1 Tax=Mola mola TaxID=94237 RepID=A0A3Q4AUD7_MOLML